MPTPASSALDQIAEILRDPEWGVGMLEDMNDIVRRAGYDTQTRYMVVGPTFDELADWDNDTSEPHPNAPIDPNIDFNALATKLTDIPIAYWKQTGDAPTAGFWTTVDRATVFVGDPGYYGYRNGQLVPTPPNSEVEPIQTWGKH